MLAFMISSTSTITHFCNMYTLLILLCNAAGLPMSRAVNQMGRIKHVTVYSASQK